MTASQTLAWLNATYDPEASALDLSLDDHQSAAWRAFSGSAVRLFGPAASSSFRDHLELSWTLPSVQVDYEGTTASIRVPYWYQGDGARQALGFAYAVGRLMEVELGMEGVDEATGVGLTDEGLYAAVRIYLDVAASAARLPGEQ
jgi:hypothetical protein